MSMDRSLPITIKSVMELIQTTLETMVQVIMVPGISDQETLVQETLDQGTLEQETLDQGISDQEILEQEANITHRALVQEVI